MAGRSYKRRCDIAGIRSDRRRLARVCWTGFVISSRPIPSCMVPCWHNSQSFPRCLQAPLLLRFPTVCILSVCFLFPQKKNCLQIAKLRAMKSTLCCSILSEFLHNGSFTAAANIAVRVWWICLGLLLYMGYTCRWRSWTWWDYRWCRNSCRRSNSSNSWWARQRCHRSWKNLSSTKWGWRDKQALSRIKIDNHHHILVCGTHCENPCCRSCLHYNHCWIAATEKSCTSTHAGTRRWAVSAVRGAWRGHIFHDWIPWLQGRLYSFGPCNRTKGRIHATPQTLSQHFSGHCTTIPEPSLITFWIHGMVLWWNHATTMSQITFWIHGMAQPRHITFCSFRKRIMLSIKCLNSSLVSSPHSQILDTCMRW